MTSISPKIIVEDEDLLVIDKPSGLTVNRDETTKGQETVQDWIESKKPENSDRRKIRSSDDQIDQNSEFSDRSGIVHRLDKDTSGLLLIAKTPEAFFSLKLQFQSREVVKKYLALVHGKVEPAMGTINAPIGRSPFNRKHFGVFPGGKEAETSYKLIKLIELNKGSTKKMFSFLELTPHTGRTHQIRVHLKYMNYPIVSDPVYGGRKNLQADLQFCPRLFLHATYLRIKSPKTGEALEFNSPLPSDLQTVIDNLQ